MTVFEVLNESKGKTEKEVLANLQNSCGLKLSEALEVCKSEFKDSEKFKEAAFELMAESLPSDSHLNEKGVTIVTGEWED